MVATYNLICGDALAAMKSLPDCSVHCVVTSPPYWSLRNYGVDGQYGLENTPEEYVSRMVEVFREVRRLLRDDGTLWLNIGDCYSGGGRGNTSSPVQVANVGSFTGINGIHLGNLKDKDLCGMPWRLAFALQSDGWWLRQDIIWSKPNPMPESVLDRCTKSHEYIFLLSKSARYYYDYFAVREPARDWGNRDRSKLRLGTNDIKLKHHGLNNGNFAKQGRNRRSVWTIPTEPLSVPHYATFPRKLVEPCVLAGTSEKGCCPKCGKPWERIVDRVSLGWKHACKCVTDETVPCTVLDPFSGTGTTGVVSLLFGRNYIGIDISREYTEIARKRITEQCGALALDISIDKSSVARHTII